MIKRYSIYLPILMMITLFSCDNQEDIDISNNTYECKINRFDQSFFTTEGPILTDRNDSLFNQLYIQKILMQGQARLSPKEEQELIHYFTTDKQVQSLKREIDKEYPQLTNVESELTDAFKRHQYYFPNEQTPKVYTLLSNFQYGAFTGPGVLGIGLDLYLDDFKKDYIAMGFPLYVVRTLNEEHLSRYALEAQLLSLTEEHAQKHLLDHMVKNGKVLYCLSKLLPSKEDTVIMKYTEDQLNWISNNEAGVWQYFIEEELLYKTQHSKFFPFISEGPTTNGLPPESPGNIGSWIGWQMIESYMDAYPETSMEELFSNKRLDGQYILNKSEYRPR